MTNRSEEERPKKRQQAVAVPPPAALSAAQRVDHAIAQGKWEEVDKLWELQIKVEQREAERAFNRAMALAKADIPIIEKTRHVSFPGKTGGRTDYWHEDMADIVRAVTPILSNQGLNVRFKTQNADPKAPITVTCKISHIDGHFEENSLSAYPDESGSKNPLQAIGSAVTYLERMTLKPLLGLAADRDDDARGSSRDTAAISPEQLGELTDLFTQISTDPARLAALTKRFCTNYGVDKLADLPAHNFEEGRAALKRMIKPQAEEKHEPA